MSQALLIPPNSHFLKTLVNFFLEGRSLDENILKTWVIFPNRRSALFFKHYLREKKLNDTAGFFPRIFSFENLIDYLYVMLEEIPLSKGAEILRLLILLEVLKEETKERFEKNFFWGQKFLEVFEEFEKEGRIPQNLIYPPENLPPIAKEIFEKLLKVYSNYVSLLNQKGGLNTSSRLRRIVEILEKKSFKETPLANLIDEVWLVGFAGLRKIEERLFKAFLRDFDKTFLVFEALEPLPEVVENTLRLFGFNRNYQVLPKKYYEKEIKPPLIKFYCTVDPHLEIKQALDLIKKNPESPDEIAVVLSDPRALVPLIYQLEQKDFPLEVNVSLLCPMDNLPLNSLLIAVMKAQKEKNNGLYPTQSYLKVLKHPLLHHASFSGVLVWDQVIKDLERFLRDKGYIGVSLEEIESGFNGSYQEIIARIHQVFFKNWEKIEEPKDIAKSLKEVLDFLGLRHLVSQPQSSWQDIVLNNYLDVFETEILPLFEGDYFKPWSYPKENLFILLEHLLKTQKIPFFGDPLKGLQILGFLETRLLYFKKIILLDVNEGNLPPSSEFNPLLTDEIKRYLGIPVYHNELWDYYFIRLINAAEEVHIFYLEVEKANIQEFKEPSRFIHRLKWEKEKQGETPEETVIQPKVEIFSKKEGIPKTEKVKEHLFKYLSTEKVSRSYFETYLKCGAKFYFKYVMKLREPEKLGFKVEDPGKFLHKFFENFFKPYEGKSFLTSKIYDKTQIETQLENLWEEFEFKRKLDPLSHYLSKKIAFISVFRYLEFWINKEKEGQIKANRVLGVEKKVVYKDRLTLLDGRVLEPTFWGIFDFIIERKEEILKYLIMDFKSNPSYTPQPKKMKEFLEKFEFSDRYDLEGVRSVLEAFGNDLFNFQLFFYYYLFHQNKNFFISPEPDRYIINAGFIRPSHFKKPEVFLFNLKNKDWALVNQCFIPKAKRFLEWLINHLLFADKFYFTERDKFCEYCEYVSLCKNYRYLI